MAIPMPVPIQHTRPRSRHESKTKAMEATLLIRTTGEGVSQVDRAEFAVGCVSPWGGAGGLRGRKGRGDHHSASPSFCDAGPG